MFNVKPKEMHPLQDKVVTLGICPLCHKKMSTKPYFCSLFTAHICGECDAIFFTDPEANNETD